MSGELSVEKAPLGPAAHAAMPHWAPVRDTGRGKTGKTLVAQRQGSHSRNTPTPSFQANRLRNGHCLPRGGWKSARF